MINTKSTFGTKFGPRLFLAGLLLGSAGLVSACSSPTETTTTTERTTTQEMVPVAPPTTSVTTTKTQVYNPQ